MAADKLQLQVILSALDKATAPLKRIQGGSIGAAKALKETRDRLKELNSQQQDVSAWRTQRAAAEQAAQAIQANRSRVSALSREIAGHEQTIRPLQTSYDALSGESTELTAKHKALYQQLRQTREQARSANQTWQENRTRIRELGEQLAKTAQPTKKLQDEYAALTAKQREQLELVRRLSGDQKELQQRHQASATSTREQKTRLAELAEQLREARAPMQALNQQVRTGIREGTQLKQQHQQQQVQLQGLRNKLNAAGISTRNLSQGERDLRTKITATNNALTEQENRLKRITTQQKRLAAAKAQYGKTQQLAGSMAAGGAAGLASGYAIARPLKGVIDTFAPAEDAATQLRVSMMGSDGTVAADFQKISDLANKLGDRLPGTTADFNEMMTMLRRQGLSAANVLGGTGEAASYLGVQLKMPVTAAAELAAKMQDATRTTETDMMSLMDTIQRGFYLGVDSDNMLQGFSKISPVMDIIKKQGLEATKVLTPLLVMMDQAGMEGGAAGNAYRKIFQGAMNNDKIQPALSDLKVTKGISLNLDFTDGKGEFGGIEKMYEQLEKLKKLNTEDRLSLIKAMFGDDSETLTTLNTMMAKGIGGYRDVESKMAAQADLRMRVNEQLGTLSNTMEAAQGSWSNTMAEVGLAIAPELKEFIKSLGEIAIKVKGWVKENPQLTAQIVKTAAGLAILLAACGGLSLMLASIAGPIAIVRLGMALFGIKSLGMVTGLKGVGSALLWVGKAMLWVGRALLMNPIGLTITAIALAAYLIYKNWEPIKGFFLGLWGEIKAGFDGGLLGIAGLILNFSPLGLFYRAFAGVMGYFGIELPGKFSEFGGMLMQGMVNGIKAGLGGVKDAITGAGDNTIGWFKEKLGIHSPSRVFAGLGGFTMAGLAQGLAGGEGDVLKQIAGTAKRLTDSGAALFGIGDTGISVDNRAPISARNGANGSRGGDTYNLTIYAAPGMDPAAIGREVQRQLAAAQHQQQARNRSRLSDQD